MHSPKQSRRAMAGLAISAALTLLLTAGQGRATSLFARDVARGARLLTEVPGAILAPGTPQASLEFLVPLDLDAWPETSQSLEARLRLGLGLGIDITLAARAGQARLSAPPLLQNEGAYLRYGTAFGRNVWGQAGFGYLVRVGAATRLSGSGALQILLPKPALLTSLMIQYEQQMIGQQRPALIAAFGVAHPVAAGGLTSFAEGRLSLFDHAGVRASREEFGFRASVGVVRPLSATWRLLASCGLDHQTHLLSDMQVRKQWALLPRLAVVYQSNMRPLATQAIDLQKGL